MKTLSINRHIIFRSDITSSLFEYENYRILWEGLVFISGVKSGHDSVRAFIKEMSTMGIQDAVRLLKGNFFMTVEEKEKNIVYAFVDNSGLYKAYHSTHLISSSFLELIRHDNYSIKDLDPQAVAEFLYFGNLFNKTFIKNIKKIRPEIILECSESNEIISIRNKKIKSISDHELYSYDFKESFRGLARSLSNRVVSIDLTGGLDSRLLALLLDKFGLEFETAVSGGAIDFEDFIISKKIANEIMHPWFSCIHSLSSMEEDIMQIFHATEGCYDIIYYHRLYQLQKERRLRGIDTVISGAGGELFKDYWWLQDFPFYSKKTANIQRLVDMRLLTLKPIVSLLEGQYKDASYLLRDTLIKELNQYASDTNTKTYDNIYYNFFMREIAGHVLSAHNSQLMTFAPYLDLDIARIGFNLPRSHRFFNMFHRKEITDISSSIARVVTTEGNSASSHVRDILLDIPPYIGNRINRLLLKIRKRNKRFNTLNNPHTYSRVRNIKLMSDSLFVLKDCGIVNKNIALSEIEDRRLGSFLSLGLLINFLSNGNNTIKSM